MNPVATVLPRGPPAVCGKRFKVRLRHLENTRDLNVPVFGKGDYAFFSYLLGHLHRRGLCVPWSVTVVLWCCVMVMACYDGACYLVCVF